jgi:phosphoenolpyruvate carboxylase
VIREQEGVEAYELVEQVRQLSVAFRRDADQAADRALKKLLKGLSGDQTVSVIRAFTYFSTWPTWPKTATTSAAAPCTSAPATRRKAASRWHSRLRWAGIAPKTCRRRWPQLISPVLTAHPTEVQRKSILDAERASPSCWPSATTSRCAQLYNSAKDALTPRELAANEASCVPAWPSCGRRGCCATASSRWPTRSRTRCPITRPPSCARSQDLRRPGAELAKARASFLRMGQWIGGDRDGNPNVTAETLRWPCAARPRWRCATT